MICYVILDTERFIPLKVCFSRIKALEIVEQFDNQGITAIYLESDFDWSKILSSTITADMQPEELYLATGGEVCPYCGDDWTIGDMKWEAKVKEFPAGLLTVDMKCKVCGEEWTDRYLLGGKI